LKGSDANTQLKDALGYVGSLVDMTVYIDLKAFERAGIKSILERPVKLPKQEDARLAEVLKHILDQAGAIYVLRDNLVLILPDPMSSS
jgi:hypothetical protein